MKKQDTTGKKLRRQLGPSLLLTVCLVLSVPVHAQDDYLSSLEAEADNTTVLDKARAEHDKLKKLTSKPAGATQKAGKPKPPAKPVPARKAKPGKTDPAQKKFEDELFKEFPGNYSVYSTFSDTDKHKVFQAYIDASDKEGLMRFGPVIGTILDLASK